MTLAILTVCTIIGRPAVDCVPAAPPLQEMPIVTTYFHPALGGVNCDLECDWMSLAPVTEAMYGYAAACPAEFVGVDFTAVISHPAIGERACLDRGAAVTVDYRYIEGIGWIWCIVVDLLETGPHPSNWTLLYGWSVQWESVSELVG